VGATAQGFYLTLLIGPAVPVPAPREVLDALTTVEVTTTAGRRSPSGFQMSFTLSNRSPLHTLFLLAGGGLIPLLRVILVVTLNGSPEVLIDGVVTRVGVAPGSGASDSTLNVTGLDLTAVMDWIDFSGIPYPAMPAEARVALILAKYAFLGVVPLIIPSIMIDVPIPVERIPRQQGKDLDYVNQLADEVGYVFYLTPGPVPGTTFAYWGPEIKVGPAQPALNINLDAYTNVESLSFNFANDGKLLPVVFIQSSETKVPIPIPIPDITPLNPPLGLIPPLPKGIEPIEGTAKLSPIQAVLIGLAKAAQSADAVTASGSLDVLRYGRVLKARQLVGVRGAGLAYDGLYYVHSVTHNIKRGEYKQKFNLTRNGLVSTLPTVPA
jgi:hypothetical protein